jgi:hypothetical protein
MPIGRLETEADLERWLADHLRALRQQTAVANQVVLTSPNGSNFKLVVDNAGNLSTEPA